MNLEKHKIFVLVGPPSVGKSTWISKNFGAQDSKSYFVVSRDDIVEQVASKFGMTYDDMYTHPPQRSKIGDEDQTLGRVIDQPNKPGNLVWDRVYEANQQINQEFEQRIRQASGFKGNIIIDMTNMEPYPRKRALQIVSGRHDEFEKIAVVFKFQGFEEQLKANALRRAEEEAKRGKYKTVTPDIMERMFKSYKPVTADEGFDKIIDVDNTASIQKLIEKKPEPAIDLKTELMIRHMIKKTLLKEYGKKSGYVKKSEFVTKTKTRADLKKLPPRQDQYAALGKDLPAIIKALRKTDQVANNEAELIKSNLGIEPKEFAINKNMDPDWIENLYRDVFTKLGLRKLGHGVSRDVYEINSEFVLKYFRPDRGDQNQNIQEIEITNKGTLGDYITKIYEVSKFNTQWMICERVHPIMKDQQSEWLDAVGLMEMYKVLSPMEDPDKINNKFKNSNERNFMHEVIKNIISNSTNLNDGAHIEEKTLENEIKDVENAPDGATYAVYRLGYLNKKQFIQYLKKKLALLKINNEKAIRMLKNNKFLQTIVRAKKEIGFGVNDLHAGNVGFTIKDKRPIILDAGWSDDFKFF